MDPIFQAIYRDEFDPEVHRDYATARTPDGRNAFQYAVCERRFHIARELHALGVSGSLRAGDIVHHLIHTDDDDIAWMLPLTVGLTHENTDEMITPLAMATMRGRAAPIHLLLGAGVPINQVDREQRPALLLVRDVGTARLLLARGADPRMLDRDGDTVLGRALLSQHLSFPALLAALPDDVVLETHIRHPPDRNAEWHSSKTAWLARHVAHMQIWALASARPHRLGVASNVPAEFRDFGANELLHKMLLMLF